MDAAAIPTHWQACEHPEHVKAVRVVLTAIYRPWLMEAATAFQQAARTGDYKAGAPLTASAGTCLLFCDALRFDAASAWRTSWPNGGLTALSIGDWRHCQE